MRRAGVALARAASAQLAVNATGLVTLGGKNVEAANPGNAFAEFDVRAAARHVRRDGDCAPLAGAGNDLGFLLVILRVEDGVDKLLALQHSRKLLADFYRNRAHEDRPALAVNGFDLVKHSGEFLALRFIDRIVAVLARNGPVRGNDEHPEFV